MVTGANVNETTDVANRTQWPLTGGSVSINGSHSSALTYVNLGLGTNVTNFNISLVENLNQTGAGVFCLKEAGRSNLEEGLIAAGYSGFDDERLNGLEATVQVIQLGHSGSALYNVSRGRIKHGKCKKRLTITVRGCRLQLDCPAARGRPVRERDRCRRSAHRQPRAVVCQLHQHQQ